jgi:hypothetical protein
MIILLFFWLKIKEYRWDHACKTYYSYYGSVYHNNLKATKFGLDHLESETPYALCSRIYCKGLRFTIKLKTQHYKGVRIDSSIL